MKMHDLMLKFPHLPEQIFQKLDNECLLKCREVSKSWQNIIDGRNYPWLRIVNIPSILKKGITYLHLAAKTGQIVAFKDALDEEEDKNIKTKFGETSFFLACKNGRIQIVVHLLEIAQATKEKRDMEFRSQQGTIDHNKKLLAFQPFDLPTNASLPTVPVSPQQAAAVSAAAAAAAQATKEKRDVISGPQQGTIEYEKMLLAYGFPPFPYPIPPGIDPSMHIHMLTNDPVYKAKYDKDRLDKEKAFKEQIDRDNREKDRKAGVKLPPPLAALEQSQLQQQKPHQPPSPAHVKNEQSLSDSRQEQRKPPPPPSHTQHPFSPMISVKPEFRQDTKKEHHHSGSSSHSSHKPEQQPKAEAHPRPPSVPKKAEDEGIKATMETRGPPPATPTSFASLMHPALMGRIPGMGGYDPAMLAGLPPHIMAQLYGSNPYAAAMAAHQQMSGQMRPPSLPGIGPNPNSQNPEDLSRSAALAMAAMSSLSGGGGSSATKALDMLAQQANQYYAAVAASQGQGMPTTTTTSSSSPSSHKIHELQERALKSPAPQRSTASPSMSLSQSLSRGATPTSMLTNTVPTTSTTTKSCTSDLSTFSKRTPSPSARGTPSGARSRSPPLQRHLHTHTHTHFGLGQLGYPLLSPNHPSGIPGVGSPGPPAAHTPFPPAGFPSKLFLIFYFQENTLLTYIKGQKV